MYKASNWETLPWKESTPRQRRIRVILYVIGLVLIVVGIIGTYDTGYSGFLMVLSTVFFKDLLLRMEGNLHVKQRSITILLVSSAASYLLSFVILKHSDPLLKIVLFFGLIALVTVILSRHIRNSRVLPGSIIRE